MYARCTAYPHQQAALSLNQPPACLCVGKACISLAFSWSPTIEQTLAGRAKKTLHGGIKGKAAAMRWRSFTICFADHSANRLNSCSTLTSTTKSSTLSKGPAATTTTTTTHHAVQRVLPPDNLPNVSQCDDQNVGLSQITMRSCSTALTQYLPDHTDGQTMTQQSDQPSAEQVSAGQHLHADRT